MPAVLAPQPAIITVQDQTPAGKILHELFLKFSNRQLETLDETVYLHEGLIVNFIKLTPLVGG